MPRRPSSGSSFVAAPLVAVFGHAHELAAVDDALTRGARLVTLLGAAGVGKSCLATRVAAASTQRDAWVCDLTEARTVEDVCTVVGIVARIPLERARTPAEAVTRVGHALAARGEVLVVLDNFEQLVDHGAATVGRWLAAAPAARFLVTSRARLRLPGEHVVRVAPLATPPRDAVSAADVARSDAVALFVARASAAHPEFALDDANAVDVADVVRALEGLPLAIELCAARVGVLPVRELARHGGPLRGAAPEPTAPPDAARPARHASLRDAIAWSWGLLTPTDQAALARCAVFRGGFSLDAAASVLLAPGEPTGHDAALARVQALHDRSLITAYAPDGMPGARRYALLESVRAFAAERLDASPDRDAVVARHAAYFVRTADAWTTATWADDRVTALGAHALDADNLAAAYAWTLERVRTDAGAAEDVLRVALALDLLATRTRTRTLASQLELLDAALRACDDGDGDARLRARGWFDRGLLLDRGGDLKAAQDSFRTSIQLARAAGDRTTEARALASCVQYAKTTDDLGGARADFDAAIAAAVAAGDRRSEIRAWENLGAGLVWSGRATEGVPYALRALEIARATPNAMYQAEVLGDLGYAHFMLGRHDVARGYFEEALALLTRADAVDRTPRSRVGGALGRVLQALGRFDDADAAFDDALAAFRDDGDRHFEALYTGARGDLRIEQGRLAEARTLYVRAVAILRDLGNARHATLYNAALGAAEAALDRRHASEREFARVAAALATTHDAMAHAIAGVWRGHLDLLAARECADSPARAAGHIADARARAAAVRASTDPTVVALLANTEELRFALRVLDRAANATARAAAGAAATTAVAAPVTRALRVGPEARWFEPVVGARVELRRQRALRLILLALVDRRRDAPGRAFSIAELAAIGWPDERVLPTAAANRVHVTLSRLRKLGLRDALLSRDDGILLDPDAIVLSADSE